MIHRLRPLVALLALALTLAACTTAAEPGPPPTTVVTGSVSAGGSVLIGSGLILVDASALSTSEVDPGDVIDAGTGLWLGPIAPSVGGDFQIVLPDEDDLPAAVVSPAATALLNADVVDCSVAVDVASALVTNFAVGFGALPGAYATTTEGSAVAIAFVSDAALDFDAPTEEELLGGRTLYTWVHASEAVELTIEGAGCASAEPVPVAGSATLEAGWNQLAWDANADLTLFTLRNDDGAADLVMSVAPPF
jgi:hypothetical protein